MHVELFEKDSYPVHRVCGEYVSNEVLPFLERLGLSVASLGAKPLNAFELSTCGGRRFACSLPAGGFGISRYRLDQAMAKLADDSGACVQVGRPAFAVKPRAATFELTTAHRKVEARVVLGCFGKRSTLDRALARPSFKRRSRYVAVKRHFRGAFPQSLVGLHAIPAGYCGISPVEDDLVNVCYMTSAATLKRLGSVRGFEANGLMTNPLLKSYLQPLTPAFDPPLVISQIDFERKPLISKGVLMLGDAAGSIHPLCGNGMAMALRAAHLAVPLVLSFLGGQLSRESLERHYQAAWHTAFSQRRLVGRWLQPLLESRALSEGACATANRFPRVTSSLIRRTHGQPF